MFTKDQQRQRDLFESERNFRLLVEGVADYALYMLDPEGVVTSWNIGGQRIKGYAPTEIIGQHFSRFYTEVDRTNGKPLRALRSAREQGRYEEEGWRVRKDGTFFWASVIIDPIYEDGNLVGLCAFHHLRCIHGGFLAVRGAAPYGLTWLLKGREWNGMPA